MILTPKEIQHAMSESDEWRSAVATLTELERVGACGHSYGRRGICAYCQDDEPRRDRG